MYALNEKIIFLEGGGGSLLSEILFLHSDKSYSEIWPKEQNKCRNMIQHTKYTPNPGLK